MAGGESLNVDGSAGDGTDAIRGLAIIDALGTGSSTALSDLFPVPPHEFTEPSLRTILAVNDNARTASLPCGRRGGRALRESGDLAYFHFRRLAAARRLAFHRAGIELALKLFERVLARLERHLEGAFLAVLLD